MKIVSFKITELNTLYTKLSRSIIGCKERKSSTGSSNHRRPNRVQTMGIRVIARPSMPFPENPNFFLVISFFYHDRLHLIWICFAIQRIRICSRVTLKSLEQRHDNG